MRITPDGGKKYFFVLRFILASCATSDSQYHTLHPIGSLIQNWSIAFKIMKSDKWKGVFFSSQRSKTNKKVIFSKWYIHSPSFHIPVQYSICGLSLTFHLTLPHCEYCESDDSLTDIIPWPNLFRTWFAFSWSTAKPCLTKFHRFHVSEYSPIDVSDRTKWLFRSFVCRAIPRFYQSTKFNLDACIIYRMTYRQYSSYFGR